MGKYIIELKKGEIAYKTVDSNGTPMIQLLAPIPYFAPNIEQVREDAFKNGYDAACKDIDIKSKTNAAYQKGLEDAWEAARKICLTESEGGLSSNTVCNIFNTESYRDALKDYIPAEAIEKLKAYEQEQGAEIRVGDVVRLKSAPEIEIWVTDISDEDGGRLSGLALKSVGDNCEIGNTYAYREIYRFERTGKHYDVAEVLEKMREG